MPGSERAGCGPTQIATVLKEAITTQTVRSYRDHRKVFYIEGVRNFVRAKDNGFDIERIMFSERLLIAPLARKLVRQYRRSGVQAVNMSPEHFRHISQNRRASGIAAIVRQPWTKLKDVSPNQGLCWVLLEQVRSPGNFGTLIRSSAAVGGAGFVLIGNSTDPFSPNVVRSAMGSIFHQRFVRTDWPELHSWLDEHKCAVIGATPSGKSDLHAFHYPNTAPLLMLGEERKGLTDRQQELCSHFVRIPMDASTDSLNLGVAGSLLMYEVYRNQNASQ